MALQEIIFTALEVEHEKYDILHVDSPIILKL